MHFKTALAKTHFNTAPSKNSFQNSSFKIAIKKTFFISASIKAVKDKTGRDKILIMHY